MQNVKMVIAYDGTKFLGWQKTPAGPSIEAELQTVLEQILQHPIHLQASSRTDAGVHAYGQVINFLTTKEKLNLERLHISINALLPKDISILSVDAMPASFHPTLDCVAKEYHYYICYGKTQLPIYRFYSWHCPTKLEIDHMQNGAIRLVGKHDFSSFCNFRKQLHYHDPIREITSIIIKKVQEERLCIMITGNHFLYKMVRNIVGTLMFVGKGKIKVEELDSIISSRDRKQAGVTAPAHGLFLYKIKF